MHLYSSSHYFFKDCQLDAHLLFRRSLVNSYLISEDIIKYLNPLFPRSLLKVDNGIGLAFILFALQAFSSIFRQTSLQFFNSLQINIRTILIGSIYEKSLKLSQHASKEFTQGQILNLINVDVEKISMVLMQVAPFLVAPIQLAVSIKLIGDLIGYAVWGGAGALFGVLFLEIAIIGFLVKYQQGFLKAGDRRLKAIREVMYGMKIIKFRALEKFFEDRIAKIRLEQLSFLKRYSLVND